MNEPTPEMYGLGISIITTVVFGFRRVDHHCISIMYRGVTVGNLSFN